MMSGNPIFFAAARASAPAHRLVRAFKVGTPSLRDIARGGLVAHHLQHLRLRADEDDARVLAGLRESGFSERKP